MSYTKEESQQQFDGWSSSYDDSILQRLLFVPSHDCLLGEMEVSADRPFRLLDIGCGTGVFARRVAESYESAEVWGIDASRDMMYQGVMRPQDGRGGIRYVQCDSESLALQTNSFDLVTCSNSFHHYPNQQAAVTEMFRVLRPGGRLMIIDGYRDRLWGRFIYDVCVVAIEGAVQHASARRFRELLAQAGFTGVRQQARLGLAPFLLTIGTKSAAAGAQTQHPSVAAA